MADAEVEEISTSSVWEPDLSDADEITKAFTQAARKGVRMMCIDGGPPIEPIYCVGCGRMHEAPLAFAPLIPLAKGSAETNEPEYYCGDCRASLLGPPCKKCGKPVSRDDGIVAADTHWHKECLSCQEPSCGKILSDGRYFEHKGDVLCRDHYLERAGERCGACGKVVDGGLRALGRYWHEGCLRCAETNEPLNPGTAYMVEGRPIAPDARLINTPPCHKCGEPALVDRLYANGCVYHRDCFRCVHCKSVIGLERFVMFDTEPYLEACYQKLFGASAGARMRGQIHGVLNRCAISVPLLVSLGEPGLNSFAKKHEELLPLVRRVLRESGIQQLASFLFRPPAVSKPSLVLHMLIPAVLEPETAFISLLQEERLGQEWEQLLTSVHDAPASRGNPWWANIAVESGPSSVGATNVDDTGKPA